MSILEHPHLWVLQHHHIIKKYGVHMPHTHYINTYILPHSFNINIHYLWVPLSTHRSCSTQIGMLEYFSEIYYFTNNE